jgi:hypothetical protein
MRDPDVVFLHALLNYHLGPPDDQLPVTGAGAADFGPRTEAKVKRFQQFNKIDQGTKYFMDGVVGPHTWKVLNQLKQVEIDLTFIPHFQLTPPSFPNLPPVPPSIVPPTLVPPLTLHLDNIQIQAGETGTFPFSGKATGAHTLQVVGVFLKKGDGFHLEGQVGPQIAFNHGPGADSKTDFGVVGVLNVANLPGSTDNFNWSIQAQEALIKSLTNSGGSSQTSVLAVTNVSLVKNAQGKDVLQATVQAGPFLEADLPDETNGHKWTLKTGVITFFGITGTINF